MHLLRTDDGFLKACNTISIQANIHRTPQKPYLAVLSGTHLAQSPVLCHHLSLHKRTMHPSSEENRPERSWRLLFPVRRSHNNILFQHALRFSRAFITTLHHQPSQHHHEAKIQHPRSFCRRIPVSLQSRPLSNLSNIANEVCLPVHRGCISSAFRIYFTEKLISEKDITFWILPIGFTADLEFFSALLVACLPVMPALYQHIRSKIAARRSRSQSRPKPQSNLRNIWPQDKPTPIPAEPSNSAGDFAPQPPPKDSGTKETQQTWLATDNTPVIREQRPLMEARETAAGAGPGCCRRRREREGG